MVESSSGNDEQIGNALLPPGGYRSEIVLGAFRCVAE